MQFKGFYTLETYKTPPPPVINIPILLILVVSKIEKEKRFSIVEF